MKKKDYRGFEALIGETIVDVDTKSINVVFIKTASGKVIPIDADEQHCGIGIIQCDKPGWQIKG